MCGFVGLIDLRQGVSAETVTMLRDTIRHRGPDDAGLYLSPGGDFALGFRRLSIIDISSAGHQPMGNETGQIWIVFNGEVYNYAELRPELEARGHVFRSRTDTEVIIHAYEEWGERCVERFIGMFAFAIWNDATRTLFMARDRLGIKPLYYSESDRRLLVASELKPVMAAPDFERQLDHTSLREYLSRGYICAPRTIFANVRSLPPGHTLTWCADRGQSSIRCYWSLHNFSTSTVPLNDRQISDRVDELDALLQSAIRYRLISDVPLGAFLSGGVDSSLVVALMRQVSNSEVKTFTVGFQEATYNEADYAAAIARHLGTTHTQLTATYTEARQVIPHLATIYDEPFADSSQIPTACYRLTFW